jgi:putative membrane protein
MILTIVFGSLMLIVNPALLSLPWMHVKLTLVFGLLVYHFISYWLMKQLGKGVFKWKASTLRIWNEVATLLLVGIVFLVIMRSSLGWVGGIIGFFSVGLLLMLGIKAYKKLRKD